MLIFFVPAESRRRVKRVLDDDETNNSDRELRRTKRNIYQALLKKRNAFRQDQLQFVDMEHSTNKPSTKPPTKRPNIAKECKYIIPSFTLPLLLYFIK